MSLSHDLRTGPITVLAAGASLSALWAVPPSAQSATVSLTHGGTDPLEPGVMERGSAAPANASECGAPVRIDGREG